MMTRKRLTRRSHICDLRTFATVPSDRHVSFVPETTPERSAPFGLSSEASARDGAKARVRGATENRMTLTPSPHRERAAATMVGSPIATTLMHSPAALSMSGAQDGAFEPLGDSNLPADFGEHPTDLYPRASNLGLGEGPPAGHPCLDTEAMAFGRNGDVQPRDGGRLAGLTGEDRDHGHSFLLGFPRVV